MHGYRAALLLAGCLSTVTGCYSKDRLTAKATPCNIAQVKILPSEFSRKGTQTAWCALCKETVYVCRTNADRSKVECNPATEGSPCR
jgi:hypothetical protein